MGKSKIKNTIIRVLDSGKRSIFVIAYKRSPKIVMFCSHTRQMQLILLLDTVLYLYKN